MGVHHSLNAPAVLQHHDERRWPVRLGLAGMAAGAIMAFNALQNLAHHLTWTDQQWRALFESLGADFVYEGLPSHSVMVASALIETVLGALLLVGSWWLFWHDHRAIGACKAWAWTTLAYVVLTGVWIFAWLTGYLAYFGGVPEEAQGTAYGGFLVTLALLAAFPLFLLYWLGREDARREYESW